MANLQHQTPKKTQFANRILPVITMAVFFFGPALDYAAAKDAKTTFNLTLPKANSQNGRTLFSTKGCVACHAINGIGGSSAAPLDAASMDPDGSVFEFIARMWVGTKPMIEMQEERLGQQIELTAQDWADIIAFIHDAKQQETFSTNEIPTEVIKLMDND